MLKMKKLFLPVIACAALLAGCTQGLKDDVAELQKRMYDLEEQMDALQANVDDGKIIRSATAFTSPAPGGVRIVFSDNSSIDVKNGTNGTNGVTPQIRVVPNADGSYTIQYNVIANYPTNGWMNAGTGSTVQPPKFRSGANGALEYSVGGGSWIPLPITSDEAYGLVAYVDNGDGTVTFFMGGEEFTFRQASSAEGFVVLETQPIEMAVGDNAPVRFRVNPSSATVPKDVENWTLVLVNTRAAVYNPAQSYFSLESIAADATIEGLYTATIACGALDPAVQEYDLTLVLANGDDEVSSTPFTVRKFVPLTDFSLDRPGGIETWTVGREEIMAPVFTPSNATDKEYDLETSDSSVVSVTSDSEGWHVLAVAPGTATITATPDDGELTDSFTIEVQ